METILICENHQYYKVPLIWTFVFPGAEYWCPYCDYIGGMLGAGDEVKATKHLLKKREKYENLVAPYLRAEASFSAIRFKYNNIMYERGTLPEHAKKKFAKICDEWKTGQRV